MIVTSRPAEAKEKSRIYELYQETMHDYIQTIWGWNEEWQKDDFDKSFTIVETSVIEVNSEFGSYYQLDFSGSAIYLRMLILCPFHRSQGIGKQVLEQILQRAEAERRPLELRVFKINTAAMKFYQRNGWVVKCEEPCFNLMGRSLLAH